MYFDFKKKGGGGLKKHVETENRIKILHCGLCFLRTIFLKPICLSMNLQEVFFFFRESDNLIDNIF